VGDKRDKKALTPKQNAFVGEYMIDRNGTQAAIRAGYSAKTANAAGSRLLLNVDICEEIQRRENRTAEKHNIDADWVISKLVENAEKAAQARPVLDREGNETGEYRYDGAVVNKALELIGKNLGMFTDKLDVKTDFSFSDLWVMARSRKKEGD
jgi:phage terminase small subunit